MRLILLSFCILSFAAACNSGEQNSAAGNSTDSTSLQTDTLGDTRGMKGAGVDNTGGTPGPGTITDTLNGKVDTADHTSKRNKDTLNNK